MTDRSIIHRKGMRAQLPLHAVLLAGLLLACSSLHGQQEVMVSQYMFNGLLLNPAYAGTHDYVSGSLMHRNQWVQVEGAPRTGVLAIDGPIMHNKMGLGFTLVHDQIGVSRDLDLSGHYAYHVRVGHASRLSFGLRAGLSVYSARLSELVYWDANDQVFQGDISNALVGKFGFGIHWSDATSFIGLSIPTLHATDDALLSNTGMVTDGYFTRHLYLHAGKVYPLGDLFDIKPSILIKYVAEAPAQADINCNILYRERFWLGIGYRTGDALVTMVEYQINPQLRIGYAYDMTTSRLGTVSTGSHEVMLGMDFGRDLVRIKTPRYF